MTHVLETGLEFLESSNPGDLPKVKGYNIINGQLKSSSDGSRFTSKNPAILVDELGDFPLSTRDDIHEAIASARTALTDWAATPAPTRGQIIGNMGRLLMEHKDAILALETREIGKTLKESAGSVQEAIDTCLFFQSEGRRLYGQTVNSELPDKELFTYRRPLGVCGIINACNFPSAVPFWKMIPAIMCGNTCVWKSPQDSPLLSFALARIMYESGLPDGVINLIHGKGSGAGQYLVDAVDLGLVDKISFTGKEFPKIKDDYQQVISPQTAYQMTSLLEGVIQRGTGKKLKKLELNIAGKTGTTNENTDAWFIGFTSNLIIGVYVGMDEPRSLGRYETGSKTALPIFKNFIKKTVKKSEARPFKVAKETVMMVIDPITGRKAKFTSKNTIIEVYKEKNVVEGKVLYSNTDRLEVNNILRFY